MLKSAVLMLAAVLSLGGLSPASASPLATPALAWTTPERLQAQDGTPLVIERGVLHVPQLYGRPGRDIEVAIVRIRREGASSSSGRAHMILAGGPGDSGIRQALGLARGGGAAWLAVLGGDDIIAMDQRGFGASRPELSSTALYGLPQDEAGSPELWTRLARPVVETEAARLRAQGIRLEAYNSREAADDVDAIRRALGYERLVLWGRSYGTHLALATARRHSDHVERLVLISPEGLDDTFKSPARTDLALRRIAERAGEPDLIDRLGRVLEALRREPVAVTVRTGADGATRAIRLGAFDVQWALANGLGDPRALARLPQLVRRMERGDYEEIGALVHALRQRAGVQSAMKAVTDVSSGATEARRRRNDTEARMAVLGDAINWPGAAMADAWGVTPLSDDFRAPLTGNIPVLMIVGDLDIRTPVENAEAVAASLTKAHVIVVENAAHAFSPFADAGLMGAIGRFLDGEAPGVERVQSAPIAFVP